MILDKIIAMELENGKKTTRAVTTTTTKTQNKISTE